MALRGLRVLEMAGLAPVPFAGMVLADFGASVIRIDRVQAQSLDTLARGKRSASIDLQDERGRQIVKKLSNQADVLIDSYRPGVMEKMGLGPVQLLESNPRLIYARLTGYGQSGLFSQKAGHDINYLSIAGVLSMLGRKDENPIAPINLLADFGGGGLLCVVGILIGLLTRSKTGKGQVIDSSMTEGASYLSTFLRTSHQIGIWTGPRGTNVLDSGAPFYDTYRTLDGKFMAVGAIEPQFYKRFVSGLGLDNSRIPNQMDTSKWDDLKELFSKCFATKTQAEWVEAFKDVDACVTPVLSMDEATTHPHNQDRSSFVHVDEETVLPALAPRFSSFPGYKASGPLPEVGQHTRQVLLEVGYTEEEVDYLCQENVIRQQTQKSRL
ncbi:alpha-methylacyl-CoA racemase-like [Corticium candelabrum]|uniref:alpha-methylacyl-CoA racemase-like n=1 Tax=Corticium candelabrum TaxID=121492 RepID=UPI002E25E2F1|nr:alpha-methylacyl-CoA racemase-like [Corticium candelabrum]